PYEQEFTNPHYALEKCCGDSPRELGSMGYRGRQQLYMKRAQVEAALEDGFILNLHGSYNTSHHEARKYFDGLDSLNFSHFETCNRTFNHWMPSSRRLASYLEWTGDVDGVTQDADGSYQAQCLEDRFWIAPACRQNVTSCIATVTYKSSLWLSMMHWSTAHGWPLALGSYPDEVNFFEKMKYGKTLFYWWEPENYRFDVDKVPLILPVHNSSEWAMGRLRTEEPPGYVGKLVSSNLQSKAPRVYTLIERFAFDIRMLEEVVQVLAEGGVSARDRLGERNDVIFRAACGSSPASPCGGGQFLLSRGDEAVGCSICSAGRFSEALLDGEGFTYRCALCPPGTYQEFANQISCNHCALGRVANQAGATECGLCPLGTFADQEGRTACESCGNEGWTTKELLSDLDDGSNDGGARRWIEVRGGTSKDVCACVEGRHLWQGQCELCLEGATCPGPTNLTLNPGFFAFPEDPGNVFRCFGNSQRCPGGLPGSCAAGRDNSSLTCAQCLPGFQPQEDGQCRECAATDFAIVVGLCLLGVLVVGCLHASLIAEEQSASHGRQNGSLLNVALGFSQLVMCTQVFGIMRRLRIPWEASLHGASPCIDGVMS
ncbi:unnamed protein product, partial [Symbiodinium sp. KB8]